MNNAVDSDPVSQEKAHICAERGFDISLSFSLALSLSLCVCDIEMSDQYGLPDFRQFMAGRTQYFPAAITQPTEPPFFLHRPPVLHCEPPTAEVLPAAGGQLVGFGHDSSTDAAGASQMDSGWMAHMTAEILGGQGKKLSHFLRSDLALIPSSRRLIRKDPCGTKSLGIYI
jgi:hypothetical protein